MHVRTALDGLVQLVGVEMLWFAGWYDGPEDGLARYDGNEYWYVAVFDETADERRFVLHEISQDQALAAWADHRDFVGRTGGPGCLHTPACDRGFGDPLAWRAWLEDHSTDDPERFRDAPAVGWFLG